MKYTLRYTARAVRDIERLSDAVKKRIGEAMLKIADSPYGYLRKMVDSNLGTYRYRIGEYRVIVDIVGLDIVVLRVGHRRDIYRRLR
ncbi:type II toxin-antitoxin system RelE family toxin [Desulfatirhabdium butyrativorans]|uniref:type II toxin-antitoxin system RelE family toxin n=1 Tax=Desulfatirhabdium butyrativorans TaxID=340467 RepID=UPI000400CB00|nr:type II toxin-antitoxin system RelE/ParE family toxin [Desulfatirhabdium butyrativorans]